MSDTIHSLTSDSQPLSFSSTTSPATKHAIKTDASSADISYSGIDAITSFANPTAQQLNFKTSQNILDLFADVPTLVYPYAESEIGPVPYGSLEKKMILKHHAEKVKQLLKQSEISSKNASEIYENLVNGAPLKNAHLQDQARAIGEKARKETQQEGNLPEKWAAHSTSNEDWVPLLIQPYSAVDQKKINTNYDIQVQNELKTHLKETKPPLDSIQIGLLKEAIETGRVDSRIADHLIIISSKASLSIQKSYGLSPSWFKGTSEIEDWKPLHLGIITPSSVNEARSKQLLINIESLTKDYKKFNDQLAKEYPSNEAEFRSSKEYLDIITDSLRDVQREHVAMQIQDAETSLTLSKVKAESIESREKLSEEQSELSIKQAKNQRIMRVFSKVMKYLGPAISCLLMAVTLLTGGAAAPLLIAAVALTAYSIADSAFGITQKAVEAVNEVLENAMPNSPLSQAIVKTVAVIAIVAVIVVLIASGSGAGTATTLAAQTAKKFTKAAVKKFAFTALRPIAIQTIVMTVMSSNALPELSSALTEKSGGSKESAQIVQGVVMIAQLVFMVIGMAFLVKSSGPSTVSASTSAASKQAATFEQTMQNLKETIKNAPNSLKKTFLEVGESFKKLFTYEPTTASNIISGFKKMQLAQKTLPVLQVATLTIQASSAVTNSVLTGMAASITEQLGDMKSRDELLLGLNNSMQTMINDVLESLETHGKSAESVHNAFVSLINSLGTTLEKFARPMMG